MPQRDAQTDGRTQRRKSCDSIICTMYTASGGKSELYTCSTCFEQECVAVVPEEHSTITERVDGGHLTP